MPRKEKGKKLLYTNHGGSMGLTRQRLGIQIDLLVEVYGRLADGRQEKSLSNLPTIDDASEDQQQ